MKKVLITGANSYIGTSFASYLHANYPELYQIDTVDMLSDTWTKQSFAGYDSVFHVAGIAHSDSGKISPEKAQLYYSVNRDLAVKTAEKAKKDGVGQFIFMSSAIVYGESSPIGHSKVIDKNTPTAPANAYGDSKLQAEQGLLPLSDEGFRVVILRPPMIYGKHCRGNYPLLTKLALRTPLFPYVQNSRSMLYIENLCEFVRLMIENGESGIFWPQNAQYSNTSELVQQIAAAHGKRIRLVKGFGWLLKLLSHMTGLVNKAFGSLTYDMQLSEYKQEYRVVSFAQSIEKTKS